MDELDKNLPDDFWRKAFDEAAETPPPRVWAAIERQLDESNGPRVVPLWGWGPASSRPIIWAAGLAAAVALLLVGWWAMNTESASTSPVAHIQQQQSAPVEHLATTPKLNSTQNPVPASPRPGNTLADASPARPGAGLKEPLTTNSLPQRPGEQSLPDITNRFEPQKRSNEALAKTETAPSFDTGFRDAQQQLTTIALQQHRLARTSANVAVSRIASATAYSMDKAMTLGVAHEARTTALSFEKLAARPLRLRTVGAIQRIVWARPAEMAMESEMTRSKHKSRELWASVSMMPGSFNPSVSVRTVQNTFTNNSFVNSIPSSQSPVNSRSNFSVAYQAGAGVKLSERWSVESGVGYLSGRSTIETPGQQYLATTSAQMDALANRNTGLDNTYVNALRNSIRSSDMANVTKASYPGLVASITANYSGQSLQTITNDYQYVQVPVQVGYQFRPRKKLNMAVLGGLLTNIFVKNTVGDALVVTAKDGVYKPVALAATMGARLRYRPSRQWSASVAGMYQPSLESGTRSDAQVQNHPTSIGMSFGVDYHFQ